MRKSPLIVCALAALASLAACSDDSSGGRGGKSAAQSGECKLVESGAGPAGTTALRAEEVASGLTVPWGLAFLPNGDVLVTERPGRVRLLRGGTALAGDPVLNVSIREGGEGGLAGIAAHPQFSSNRLFYIYYTNESGDGAHNRVERFRLSDDGTSAQSDRVIIDGIPAGQLHDGGRIRFGPDGMLYIGTGDTRNPESAQDPASLGGKILRVTPDGAVPSDNPFGGSPVYLLGIRNTQGFDWLDDGRMIVSDHGPTGELGRTGGDEVTIARAGDNLGWPVIWKCQERSGFVSPILSWNAAVPPGGAALLRGSNLPGWDGNLILGTLLSMHVHRVILNPDSTAVTSNEVYLEGNPPEGLGRVREVIQAPDGTLWVTTSNCDGRGDCGAERDKILKILP